MFWNNGAETWIDIKSSKSMLDSIISFFKTEKVPEMDTHWYSESGIIDMFIMLGPKPHDVSHQYATITGTTTLPPVSLLHLSLKQYLKIIEIRCTSGAYLSESLRGYTYRN